MLRHVRFRVLWQAIKTQMRSLPHFLFRVVPALKKLIPSIRSVTIILPRKRRLIFKADGRVPIITDYPWIPLLSAVPPSIKEELGAETVHMRAIARALLDLKGPARGESKLGCSEQTIEEVKALLKLGSEDTTISQRILDGAMRLIIGEITQGR